MCASAFCWRTACQRRGGNPPAPAFPRRGKRERGRSGFLAASSSRLRRADGRLAAGRGWACCSTTFLSLTVSDIIGRSLGQLSRSLASATQPLPCFYPHSEWAVRGPVQVGVRSKAQVHHTVTDLGCGGAAIYSAISGGSARHTQSPEQGGGCFAYQTSRDVCLLASALSTQCWLCFLLWLPECGCSEWLCLGGLLLDLGRLGCFRCRRALA